MLKRLIEVALPLKEVSEQSAREKSIAATSRITSKAEVTPHALVADDSSAQPDRPGDCRLAPLAAVRRFRMVANPTGSAAASDSGRASHQTGAEGYTTMFEWCLREKNR